MILLKQITAVDTGREPSSPSFQFHFMDNPCCCPLQGRIKEGREGGHQKQTKKKTQNKKDSLILDFYPIRM